MMRSEVTNRAWNHFDRLVAMVALAATAIAWAGPKSPASKSQSTMDATRGELQLTYLGNAGWQIEDGQTSEVKAASPKTKVIVPQYFQPIRIP